MDTGASYGAFEHTGIFDGIGFAWVGRYGCLLQLRTYGIAVLVVGKIVGKFWFHPVRQAFGHGLTESIAAFEWQLFDPCHVLDGVLGRHGAIGDDMGAVFVAVLVHDPLQHLATSVVVEVGVYIRERDSVRIEETLEKQVILEGVETRDAQTVGYHASGCRTTSRSYPYAELLSCRVDEILHDEEVAGETHGLHDVKFKAYAVIDFLGYAVFGSPCRQLLGLQRLAFWYLAVCRTIQA